MARGAVTPPKAILFDLDDTIISFSGSSDTCWRKACAAFAGHLPDVSEDDLFSVIKDCRMWYWEDAARSERGRLDLRYARREVVVEAFRRLGHDDTGLAHALADMYSRAREDESAVWLIPGALEAVHAIREQGIRTALVTNGAAKAQRRKIERFALEPYFDYILVEGEFGAGKPDPHVYEHVLEQLGARAEDTWMVGDSLDWDVMGPQQVGIRGVWINTTQKGTLRGNNAQPDLTITSVVNLLRELEFQK